MEELGYKTRKEEKEKMIYCRMDRSMKTELGKIRNKTGISVSELLRQGARMVIAQAKEKGSVNLM